ncbi:unnamed protein product [Camellia sinensis]
MSRESSGDDHFDLESQSHLLVKDGGDNSTASTSGPSHRWRSIIIILHVRQAFISSARNKSLAVYGIEVVPPPLSIATSNTGGGGDGLQRGLALLMDPPTKTLMKKSPIRSIDSPMTRTTWRNIVLQALYQAAILVTFRFKGQAVLDTTQKVSNAMIFYSFVLCQVFNWFNARELERKNVFKGIHRNCWFWMAMVGTIVLLALYTKIANIFAGSARLNPEQWAFCFLIGAVSWVIDWAVKSTSDFIADRFHCS